MNKKKRLTREARFQQLMEEAWRLIREEGTEALTLGRLAERAGVTKPVVYDHFGSRTGLLAELYKAFDERQTALMDKAIAECEQALEPISRAIADCYIDCVDTQGREIPDVIAALAGSPELEQLRRQYVRIFIDKCRRLLAPFIGSGTLPDAAMWALVGVADAVSYAATGEEITAADAKAELATLIRSQVERFRK
ncbi:TetR/AcrR family transcriptional regulator [Enterobacteriaceae bacterium BIT-l23]|uniref:TetR/AcrR family transcriptional regulator n=1 Tax=Jejubacter calystegiae TaxID=2579935 RepID=A0A4P8YLZ4_9ENTR|nr:TetR/AcrR family transcriptional regulator [Jejubacter calystegiae]NUU68212.1 TetR/AcrR family transcriptional regulator [Enterobacteriaceae bacterium BIT-l23]QCT21855.1 TetR/AcrR family transcriptional regulator [Jejubacter calystegiae]